MSKLSRKSATRASAGAASAVEDIETPAICPLCGGPLQIVTDGYIGKRYAPAYAVISLLAPCPVERYVMVLAPFGACSQCEFCQEIRT